ncbi:MAG: sigma-54-dependent Fis family transcriptional regulator [Muribaculaceae bacterium]|nr:sigma-54-dependent Fis family transcriptional regulator [Muribaculaceae bacterium]
MTREIPEEILQVKQRLQIIGDSPALIEAIKRAVTVAPIDLSVLVTGPSGAGKEFFPKIIHQFGARKHKKYIAVNCGAIPEGTIDSELFGHEKGSFTGALSARKGYFEEADGGTIFLDEVAELPLTTQARLLRVLESGEFLKVGSSTVQTTDIRIVAATNVDLTKAVAEGRFREDLYYRLSTVLIHVPPLQERGNDIILLARKFAADFSEKYMTKPVTFSEDAKRAMLLYNWPGNVRQLKNVIDQIALFEAGTEISRDKMLEALPLNRNPQATPMIAPSPDNSYEAERKMIWQMLFSMREDISRLREQIGKTEDDQPSLSGVRALMAVPRDESPFASSPLDESEKRTIEETLARHGGNKKLAAEELRISVRTLYRKMQELGIS